MQRSAREEEKTKRLLKMLETMANGTVVVEGKHDVEVLSEFGIHAIRYTLVVSGKAVPAHGKTVFLSMDDDRGGEEKKEKAESALLEMDKGYEIDTGLPRRLLRMLNVRCMEQIRAPAMELIERGSNGKNLSRNSKVHG